MPRVTAGQGSNAERVKMDLNVPVKMKELLPATHTHAVQWLPTTEMDAVIYSDTNLAKNITIFQLFGNHGAIGVIVPKRAIMGNGVGLVTA
mgnify:CR=1 FL=1